MAQLYSNENFPFPVVEELRQLGHNVLTIQETGKADQAQRIHRAIQESVSLASQLIRVNRPSDK